MLTNKSIASLTLAEARILLEPETVQVLLGVDLETLEAADEMLLVEALASSEHPSEFWIRRVAELYVTLLDVNRASTAALGRIPGLLPAQVEALVRTRPYFTLPDLSREGADLQEVARLAASYLAHEGYVFIDKPQGKMVELAPASTGIIIKRRADADFVFVKEALQAAGLLQVADDSNERLLICHWQIPLPERATHLRTLKESGVVETIAPFLEDAQGMVRLPYPDRLDLALHQDVDEIEWEKLLDRFRLTLVQPYTATYGSVRVEAHPHDLGALYRTLRALALEPIVRFIEPTYLLTSNS